MDDEEFITESVLGTKQYWDDVYQNDLANAEDSCDDTWFGKRNANMIISWIKQNIHCKESICDIGCGNGWMLAKLAELNFDQLCGIDYSSKSIEYCRLIHAEKNQNIRFQVVDILKPNAEFSETFKVILDKGTYDALCLTPGANIELTRQLYIEFVRKHLQLGGHFILMSCNFTQQELCRFILKDQAFRLVHEFDTPKFQFGGVVGKQVTGLVFACM